MQTQISSILLQILHYFKCRFIILMKDSLTPLSLMLWKFPNNEDNHSHVVFPVSIGLVIWYCNHSAAIRKASRGTMRHALLTTSPCWARKAVKHENRPWKTWRDKIKSSATKWNKSIITIEEWIEVLVTVKVHTGVFTTGAIVSRWETSLERKIKLWVYSVCLNVPSGG